MTSIRHLITLIESMNFVMLDEAIGLKSLLKTYGAKIAARFAMERDHTPPDVLAAIAAQPGESDEEKVIAYLMSMDPNNRQSYTVWLVTRYLQGDYLLEDAARLKEHLTVFDQVKQRLPNKDILKYRVADLHDAIQPFLKNEAPPTARSEEQELARRMHQPDQAKILYNDADLKVLVPLTKEASCYFGRNTQWCTAAKVNNYHDYYSNQGPLVVILFKKENRRYQFHFESRQFKDERDAEIDKGALLRAHPILMRIIGEDKFLPWLGDIGIGLFSREAIENAEPDVLARGVKTIDDFNALPGDIVHEPEFMVALAQKQMGLFAQLPEDYYADVLDMLLPLVPPLFKIIPEHLRTPELAEIAVDGLTTANQIEHYIAREYWTPKIERKYWGLRTKSNPIPRLRDVPEQYRDETSVVMTLGTHVNDIPEFADLLTPELAAKIANQNVNAVKTLPLEFVTPRMVQAYWDSIRSYHINGSNKADLLLVLKRFPPHMLDHDMVMALIRSGVIDFGEVPEQFRDEPWVIDNLIRYDPKAIGKIPDRYLTPAVLGEHLNDLTLPYVNPALVGDEDVLRVVRKVKAEADRLTRQRYARKIDLAEVLSKLYAELPQAMTTTGVRRIFAQEAAIPVADLPDDPDLILKRLVSKPEEAADIPERLLTEDYAETLAKTVPDVFAHLPDAYRTEPVLFGFAKGIGHHYDYRHHGVTPRKLFQRFPSSAWSPRVVAAAIAKNLIEPDPANVPEGMLTKDVAAMLVARKPEVIAQLPPDLIDEEMLLKTVESANPHLIPHLKPEQVTEPVAHALLQKHVAPTSFTTKHVKYQPGRAIRDWSSEKLAAMPREHWAARDYALAAGSVLDLKDIPAKFRKKDVVAAAVLRDPFNLTALKDPAGWLNANEKVLAAAPEAGNLKDKKWLDLAEANGVIKIKKQGFVNVADLPRQPLQAGGALAEIKHGDNRRFYLFDKKGKFVVRIHVDKGAVTMPEWMKAQAFRQQVLEIANEHLTSFGAGQLVKLGIHKSTSHGGGFYLEEDAERKKLGDLDYAVSETGGKSVLTVWLGKRQMLRHVTERTRGYNWNTVETSLPDPVALIPHGKDLLKIILREAHAYARAFYKVGIKATNTGGWGHHYLRDTDLVTERQIGQVGDLSVWTNGRRIGIVGPQGMMADGVILKKGNISKVHIDYDFKAHTDAINAAFAKMEQALVAQRAAKK